MFNVGGGEIFVVLVIALLVLGPERLPGAARQIGRALAEFRRVSTGVQQDLREALGADDLVGTMSSLREVADIRGAIRDEIRSVGSSFADLSAARSVSGASTFEAESAAASIAPPDGLIGEQEPVSTGGVQVGAPAARFVDVLGPSNTSENDSQ